MITNPAVRLPRFACSFVLLATILGCTQGPQKAAPVDPALAMTSLRTTLDAWKAGKKIDSMSEQTPPIVAQDFDWMAGATLLEYEIKGEGRAEDANLRVDCQLKIRDAQGQTTSKTVAYIVGTDPKITVFRALE